MVQYLEIFIDKEYPRFIDKYLETRTLKRLKHVSQFCGCDYTKLYSVLFEYMRFDHSLVVAHMVWHFTHDKESTIAALLHDVGTPCFAHCIDFYFKDFIKQSSSEKNITDMIKDDDELLNCLKMDGLSLDDFRDLTRFPILENSSPRLCADRLDGVLHTCYIWLHTHSLEEIKEVYEDMAVLKNEEGILEIGFKTLQVAMKFVDMVHRYSVELQSNTGKYVMNFVSNIVSLSIKRGLLSLDDLYSSKEEELCALFEKNYPSWRSFQNASTLVRTDVLPEDRFFVSLEVKKRTTVPLVVMPGGAKRVTEVSACARKKYNEIENYRDSEYAYVDEIREIDSRKRDVVFLDFDGVVNDIRNRDVRIDERFVAEIKRVLEATGASVVVISSQEMDERYIEPLVQMGLNIHDCLPSLPYDEFQNVKDEDMKEARILRYLENHSEVRNFVIIEDDSVMKELYDHQVFIEKCDGFCSRYVEPTIRILEGNLGFYPSGYDRSESIEARYRRLFPDSFLDDGVGKAMALCPIQDIF